MVIFLGKNNLTAEENENIGIVINASSELSAFP
jgi:hypothetical protein